MPKGSKKNTRKRLGLKVFFCFWKMMLIDFRIMKMWKEDSRFWVEKKYEKMVMIHDTLIHLYNI